MKKMKLTWFWPRNDGKLTVNWRRVIGFDRNIDGLNLINTIVEEIRLIRFSQMDEKEKQVKYDVLRNEFEKVMHLEEKRVEEVMKSSSILL